MCEIKQIPYGVADFVTVMEQGLYYVDKTMYLSEMEKQPRNLIFIRPRRFGKSLLISMMQAYYDKAMADRFVELFGPLWIGNHPTPLRNRYQVLYFDFSQIGGNISELEKRFNLYCSRQLDFFVRKYAHEYPEDFKADFFASHDASDKLMMLTTQAKMSRIPLYLIIDEYDNFTNVVLNEQGQDVYLAITHASGFYREVFKLFKGNFERIFLTGVSPVTLDDLTSGFNIGWNISTRRSFDKMLGFSTEDVRHMFSYYKEVSHLPAACDIEEMMADMKPWYDNYCFSKDSLEDGSRVFNCGMVLYYLCNYMNEGKAPEQMIDPNTKTDYCKLKKLLRLDKLDGNRKGMIQQIAEEGQMTADLYTSFSAMEMTQPDRFASLLFYYGMLTIKGTYGSQLILGIPNHNVRKQYYEYLLDNYAPYSGIEMAKLKNLFTRMAFDGCWKETLQYMADAYQGLSSVRDVIEGERNIQGFFLAYFGLNDYYLVAPELELQHGYCDFFLFPDKTHYQAKHSYIIELKYLPRAQYEVKAKSQWKDAVDQINIYAMAFRVKVLGQGTQLHKIVMQFCGWELVRIEEV